MSDVQALLAAMTLDEKVALTTGAGWWGTAAIERLGIPSVGMSDGPNGVRGPTISSLGIQSVCLPCGTALGATWDVDLLRRVGGLLARQAIERACHIILAPTINIVRSPLAGRNFETYGEDPQLTGALAAAYVTGIQEHGAVATLKHFVGNEAEFERYMSNSVIDERALREIYLRPFEMAIDAGHHGAVMTSYNRVNGEWVNNDRRLLTETLREEWGFDGVVMTDWFAVLDTQRAADAGLNLEMPGPPRGYGAALAAAVDDGRVAPDALDRIVTDLLVLIDRLGLIGKPSATIAADMVDRPEDRQLAAEAAAASMVLLSNDGLLPLDPAALRTVAVIGPNARRAQIMGGGAAHLTPFHLTSPYAALRAALPHSTITFAAGVDIDRNPQPLGTTLDVAIVDGTDTLGAPVGRQLAVDGCIRWMEQPPGTSADHPFCFRATGALEIVDGGEHTFTLAQVTPSRLFVNGRLVLDGIADPPPPGGLDFFGLASRASAATMWLAAGTTAEIVIEGFSDGRSLAPGFSVHGVTIGHRAPLAQQSIVHAAAVAAAADVAVVVVGTTDEWEHEMADRTSIELPGGQVELIRAVAAANRRTVVVVNAAGPVDLGWLDQVPAALVCWFGGQEMATALAEVLTGAREPGGRMPFTVPERLEHNPAHGNFPGENGEVRYGESIFVGYRGYEHRALPVRVPFGFGLGYTTCELGEAQLSTSTTTADEGVTVRVTVTNVGQRPGTEVVQCYVAPPAGPLARPPKELKAFAKVHLQPGERQTVALTLDRRAFAAYEPGQADWESVQRTVHDVAALIGGGRPAQPRRSPGWVVEPGQYRILVGTSSAHITSSAVVDVA